MSHERLFVLGSGFSSDIAGIPTLTALSKDLVSNYKSLPKHIEIFLDSVPRYLHSNVENLLSYLSMDLPWSEAVNSYLRKAAFLVLSRKIAELINSCEKKNEIPKEQLIKLISIWHDLESPVITFNYDTVVEQIVKERVRKKTIDSGVSDVKISRISELSKKSPLLIQNGITYLNIKAGFIEEITSERFKTFLEELEKTEEFQKLENKLKAAIKTHSSPRLLNQTINPWYLYHAPLVHLQARDGGSVLGGYKEELTFRYYKLHGSLNWYYSGLQEVSDEPIYCDPCLNPEDSKPYLKGLTNLLIPPVLDKNSFYKNHSLSIQWREAYESIRSPDLKEIYFVGYSFPPTDFIAKNLFASGLDGKAVKIYIVSKFINEDAKKDLLRSYLMALTQENISSIEGILRKNFNQNEIRVDNLTFDWSLSATRHEESSVSNLVSHLEKMNE